MRSIQVQNKQIIYMTPTIERVFIKERAMSYAYSNYHEVYASIKGEDRFLGRYKNREDAIAAMESAVVVCSQCRRIDNDCNSSIWMWYVLWSIYDDRGSYSRC